MGRARIPADIRSGAVEAGDLVFLYRNLAAPESSGKKDNPDPDKPEPGTDEDGKEVTPPISPDGGKTPDGLLPVDVYKRQDHNYAKAKAAFTSLSKKGAEYEDDKIWFYTAIIEPVSYTHLDVYKRQSSNTLK